LIHVFVESVKFVVTVNIHFRMAMEGNQRLCITFSRQTPTHVFFLYLFQHTTTKINFIEAWNSFMVAGCEFC